MTKKSKQSKHPPRPASNLPARVERDAHTLYLAPVEPGQTETRRIADLMAGGVLSNAQTAVEWSSHLLPDLDLTESVNALAAIAGRVNAGNLADAEALLMSQALALNTIFTSLARRARQAELIPQFETNLKMALRAQSQAARTLEILAAVKYPTNVFARQANIAHGPQQVNSSFGGKPEAPAPVTEIRNEPMDVEGEQGPAAGHLALAAVGEIDGPTKR